MKVRFKKGSSKTAFKESDFVIRTNNEVRASRKLRNFLSTGKIRNRYDCFFRRFAWASKFFRSLKRSCTLRFLANFRCKSNRNGGVDPAWIHSRPGTAFQFLNFSFLRSFYSLFWGRKHMRIFLLRQKYLKMILLNFKQIWILIKLNKLECRKSSIMKSRCWNQCWNQEHS